MLKLKPNKRSSASSARSKTNRKSPTRIIKTIKSKKPFSTTTSTTSTTTSTTSDSFPSSSKPTTTKAAPFQPSPSQSNQTKPNQTKLTNNIPKLNKKIYNTGLPGEPIPPEGVIIFEHRARGWLTAVAPLSAIAGIGTPLISTIGAMTASLSPEISLLFACLSFSAMFAGYQGYKFTQSQVHLTRLMPDNIVQFETVGFFGYRRFVTYPANYIFPIISNPDHGAFGFKVKFLPLIQELEQEKQVGSLETIDSGLVVATDLNYLSGNQKIAWNNLITGKQVFGQIDAPKDKSRRIVAMV